MIELPPLKPWQIGGFLRLQARSRFPILSGQYQFTYRIVDAEKKTALLIGSRKTAIHSHYLFDELALLHGQDDQGKKDRLLVFEEEKQGYLLAISKKNEFLGMTRLVSKKLKEIQGDFIQEINQSLPFEPGEPVILEIAARQTKQEKRRFLFKTIKNFFTLKVLLPLPKTMDLITPFLGSKIKMHIVGGTLLAFFVSAYVGAMGHLNQLNQKAGVIQQTLLTMQADLGVTPDEKDVLFFMRDELVHRQLRLEVQVALEKHINEKMKLGYVKYNDQKLEFRIISIEKDELFRFKKEIAAQLKHRLTSFSSIEQLSSEYQMNVNVGI